MDGIFVRIREVSDSLTKAEKAAADVILKYPESVLSKTITDFASFASCSTASISRLCRKLGLSSFAELRVSLARAIAANRKVEVKDRSEKSAELNTTSGIIEYVTDNTISEITLLRDLLSEKSVNTSVSLIREAKRIFLYGIGSSGLVAEDLKYKLSRLGIAVIESSDEDLMKVYISSATSEDLVIFFSYSGTTQSVISLAKRAKKGGLKIISITKIGRTPLTSLSDAILNVPASESSFRESASLSRIMQLLVVDVLFNALVARMDNSIKTLVTTWDSVHQKDKTK